MDRRAHAVAKLEMAGHEVGVEVREDDVLDRQAGPRRVLDVLIDVPARIDDDGGVGSLVADQVGRLGQPR
jgi:hypothetical protein